MASTRFEVEKFSGKNIYVLLGNTVQGGVVLSFTLYLSILCIYCTQLWHRRMSHICVRGLVDLSKWSGFLYSEKFGSCEGCALGKQHGCVTLGDSILLCLNK